MRELCCSHRVLYKYLRIWVYLMRFPPFLLAHKTGNFSSALWHPPPPNVSSIAARHWGHSLHWDVTLRTPKTHSAGRRHMPEYGVNSCMHLECWTSCSCPRMRSWTRQIPDWWAMLGCHRRQTPQSRNTPCSPEDSVLADCRTLVYRHHSFRLRRSPANGTEHLFRISIIMATNTAD